ncbi:MAG: DUF1707 and DUF2154 domain-containing protein [Kofleriaceae bacterium]|nr:DUF1707 and DUF2154 domain-containing protein [Kofleriaceae bacterium]
MSDAPAPPATSLVALRDRREQVIAQLTDAFGQGEFEVEELERRLDLAHAASSLAELTPLVADLAAPATTTALVPASAAAVERADRPAKKRFIAIMSGVVRKGRWTVPRKMQLVALMGGAELDFREAEFGAGVTELHVTCLMGGAEITVPPWLAVESDATAIMGGFEGMDRGRGTPDPDRPLLRITGLVIMGGVEITTRMPGETRREARKREKQEAKALGGGRGAGRVLPPGSGS